MCYLTVSIFFAPYNQHMKFPRIDHSGGSTLDTKPCRNRHDPGKVVNLCHRFAFDGTTGIPHFSVPVAPLTNP